MREVSFMMGTLFAAILNSHAFAGEPQNPRKALGDEATIASNGQVAEKVVIETVAVAVKETETKEQMAKFGEVYAFSPSFIAVYRDQPIKIELWNLQSDDPHDFTLMDPNQKTLMTMTLEPLAKKSMVVTFHREGLFHFRCSIHQPEMSGEILVLPPSQGF